MADDKKKDDAKKDDAKKTDAQLPTNAPSGASLDKVMAAAKVAPPTSDAYGVENCCVREFWAVVERDGTIVRGRNVWRVARLAPGIYEVIFTGDVSNGVYNATIGRPGIFTEPAGFITVALRASATVPEIGKGVWVDTHDPNGNFSDRAFHLSVLTQ